MGDKSDDEFINNDTNLPVKVPKKKTAPKQALRRDGSGTTKKPKSKSKPEEEKSLAPGTVKIQRGKFLVRF